ncbi:MAG: 6-carboxytetrahydropterin synthase QueD [Candidatus Omnitrophica bacterium]|nr:6-carboxytetrahydropterin synthase QueD [Candidatus Omnitrophota bacterium]
MYKVTKEIHFCYGHRLLNYEGKCRFLHGHNAKVQIELTSDKLDHRGMVMDFNDMKSRLQNWVDETLDHKMVLNKTDPLLGILTSQKEPVVVIDQNPTAETICRMIFDEAKKLGFPVTEVRFWETPTSFASFRPNG